jgi:hypothetical protein
MTRARNCRGFDPDGVAETEADHFGNCPVRGALLDMRDLALRCWRMFTTRRLRSAKVRSRLRASGLCNRDQGKAAAITRGRLPHLRDHQPQ